MSEASSDAPSIVTFAIPDVVATNDLQPIWHGDFTMILRSVQLLIMKVLLRLLYVRLSRVTVLFDKSTFTPSIMVPLLSTNVPAILIC